MPATLMFTLGGLSGTSNTLLTGDGANIGFVPLVDRFAVNASQFVTTGDDTIFIGERGTDARRLWRIDSDGSTYSPLSDALAQRLSGYSELRALPNGQFAFTALDSLDNRVKLFVSGGPDGAYPLTVYQPRSYYQLIDTPDSLVLWNGQLWFSAAGGQAWEANDPDAAVAQSRRTLDGGATDLTRLFAGGYSEAESRNAGGLELWRWQISDSNTISPGEAYDLNRPLPQQLNIFAETLNGIAQVSNYLLMAYSFQPLPGLSFTIGDLIKYGSAIADPSNIIAGAAIFGVSLGLRELVGAIAGDDMADRLRVYTDVVAVSILAAANITPKPTILVPALKASATLAGVLDTPAGPVLSSAPGSLIALGDVMAFTAYGGAANGFRFAHGREPWILGADGTPRMMIDLMPGTTSSGAANFMRVGNRILFDAVGFDREDMLSAIIGPRTAVAGRRDLYAYETDTGRTFTIQTNLSLGNEFTEARWIPLGNRILFAAARNGGYELWSSNGLGYNYAYQTDETYMVKDIVPGTVGSDPRDFVSFNNRVFFTAKVDAGGRRGIYTTDGTAAGTRLVYDPGPGGSIGSIGIGTFDDNIAPTITLDALGPYSTSTSLSLRGQSPSWDIDSAAVIVTGPAGVPARLPAQFDGTAWSVNMADVPEGTYSFTAEATDISGNVGQSATRGVIVDRTPPETGMAALAAAWAGGPVIVRGQATAGDAFQVLVEAVGLDTLGRPLRGYSSVTASVATDGSWTAALPIGDGSWSVKATASDRAGNADPTPGVSAILVDRTAPAGTTVQAAGLRNAGGLYINAAQMRNIGGGRYEFLNQSQNMFGWDTVSFKVTVTAPDGSKTYHDLPVAGVPSAVFTLPPAIADGIWTITAQAVDALQNTEATPASVRMLIDTTAPVLTYDPVPSWVPAKDFVLTGTASPDTAFIDVSALGTGANRYSARIIPVDGAWTWRIPDIAEGRYSLFVSAEDRTGNRTDQQGMSTEVDRTAPAAALTSTYINGRIISGVSAFDTASVKLELTSPSGATSTTTLTTADWTATKAQGTAGGSWFFTYKAPPEEGTWLVRATATDRAGNKDPAPTTATLVVDRTAPTGHITEVPAFVRDGTVAIGGTATAGDARSVTVTLDGRSVTAPVAQDGSWRASIAAPSADGRYSIAVSVRDATGNSGSAGAASFAVTRDAPVTTIFGIDGQRRLTGWASNAASVTVTLTDPNGVVSSDTVPVNPQDWSWSYRVPANSGGAWQVAARATGVFGAAEPGGAQYGFTLADRPKARIDAFEATSGLVTGTVEPGSFPALGVRLTYTRPDGSQFTTTAGVQPDLTWSTRLSSPPDGAWAVSVVAFDVTSEDGPAVQAAFLVDRTPPETVLAPPPGFVATRDVPVAGTTTGDATQVRLTFVEVASASRTVVFAPVAADRSWSAVLPNPAEGKWRVDAAALDALGNIDATPATGGFTVQRAAPTTVINTLQPATSLRNVTVSGQASGAVSVTLTVTGPDGAQTTQSVPVSIGSWSLPLSSLADGAWSFKAAAVSGAGVVDPEGATASVVVDTVAPQITIDAPAPSTRADGLVLTGSSTAGDTRRIVAYLGTPGEYRTITVLPGTDGRWSIPVSGMVPGVHTVTAFAYDQVELSSSAGARWVVDRTAPTSTLGALPAVTRAAVQTISGRMSERGLPGDAEEVTVTAPDGTVSTYVLPGGAWSFDLPITQDGLWSVAARGTDAAGNVEAAAVLGRFVADRTAPETALRPLPAVVATNTPVLTVDTEPGISRVRMTITTPEGFAAWSGVQELGTGGTLQPLLYRQSANLIDGTYTIDVAAIDAAGNEDPTPASLTVTVDRTAPRAAVTGITGIPLDGSGVPTAYVTAAPDVTISGTADRDAQFVTLQLQNPAGDILTVERPVAVAGGVGTWSLAAAGMEEGLWRLVDLRATDAAGNVTLAAVANPRLRGMDSFAVDRTAPDTVLTATRTLTSSHTLEYAFSGSGAGWGRYADAQPNETARVRVTVTRPDGTVIGDAPFVPGGNDASQDGVYTVVAAAVDAAGNEDATPEVVRITVDHAAPEVAFDPVPALTREAGLTVTGTTSPDTARIELTVNGAARTVLPVDGVWSTTLADLPEAAIVLQARAVDLVGNVGAWASTSVLSDRTAPDTTLDPVADSNAASLTVTGRSTWEGAKAASVRLVVTRPTGRMDSYDVAVNADGSFSGAVEVPEIGSYTISAAATDLLGNTDASPAQRALQVVRGGPAVAVTEFAQTPDRLALQVAGTVQAAGAAPVGQVDLTYILPDQSVRTATVGAVNGTWTATLTLAGDGDYVVLARAADVLGNRNDGDMGLVTVDRTAPRIPVIGAISPDTGISATDRITNQPIDAVTVTAEAGTTVKVTANGTPVGTGTADASGVAVVTLDTPLGAGSWVLRATATDASGNTSPASAGVSAIQQASAPVPTINHVTPDGGASASDGVTAAGRITVVGGSAGAGSQVVISAGGVVLGTQTTTGGFYSIDLGALAEGSYPLVATQTDPAGNVSSPSATFNLVVDRSTPAPVLRIAPDTGRSSTDGITSSASVSLLGTAEPGSTVTIYRNGAYYGTAIAKADGSFADNAFLAAPATQFTAVATDAAGNVAGSAPITVTLDQVAPTLTGIAYRDDTGAEVGAASLRPVVRVTGLSEPGAQVVLRQGTLALGSAIAAADGSFSVALDAPLAFAGTYSLSLQATDIAGNASAVLGTDIAVRSGLSFAAPAQSPSLLPDGAAAPAIALADWNGDGVADALIATADGVRVMLGNGAGGFATASDIALPFAPAALASADLDRDGDPDLVVAPQGGTALVALRPDGSVLATTAIAGAVRGLVLGDVDGDGAPDLLAIDAATGAVTFRSGLGDGGFGAPGAPVPAPDAAAMALGDMTGDGVADLVVAARTGATMAILAGDGTGHFTLDRTLALDAPASSLAIADLNRDGRPDLITLENGAVTLRLAGADGFGTPATLRSGVAGPLASADLDADTRPDLAALVAGPGILAFLNTSSPTVRGVSASIADGTLGIGGTVDLVLGFSSEVKVAGGVPLLRLANGGTAHFIDGSGTNALRFRYVVQPGEDAADIRLAAPGALLANGAVLTDQYGLAPADTAGADGLNPAGLLAVDATAPTRPGIAGITPDTGVAGDGVTTSGTLSVSGLAEAGSTVRILAGETLLGTGTADAAGGFAVALGSPLPEGITELTVQARDAAGNASALSIPYRVTVDRTAPAAPAVAGLYRGGNFAGSLVNAAVSELRGTAEPFSTVRVREGTAIVGTGTADAGGAFRATVTLAEGGRSLSVAAIDAAGNVSAETGFDATVDLGVAAPVIDKVANAFFNSSGTMLWQLTGRGEPGAQVYINRAFVTHQYSASATVGPDGTFSAEMVADPGSYDFQISATDPAFNRYNGSVTLEFDADAPAAPVILGVSPDTGTDADDGVTHTGAVTVSGIAEPGSTVRLTAGGSLLATGTADAGGRFALALPAPLAEGAHVLLANATDAAGNVSGASTPFLVAVDSTAPAAPAVLGLAAGPAGVDGRMAASGTVTLQGLAEPYGTVRVRSGSVELGNGVADGSGRFAVPLSLAAELSSLTLTATDGAGNESGAGGATVAAPRSLAFAGRSGIAVPAGGVGQAALVLGDWTGDGVADLVVAGDGGAHVLRGDGAGAFTPFGTLLAAPARGLALGDLDGDGMADAAILRADTGTVTVRFGNGGMLADIPGVADAIAVGSADVTGDGIADLVVLGGGAAGLSTVRLAGGVASSPVVTAAVAGTGLALGDLDGDGVADLAVIDAAAGSVTVRLAARDGSFLPGTPVALPGTPVAVRIGDANGDGFPDVAVATQGTDALVVLPGNGTGALGNAGIMRLAVAPSDIRIADVTGDGVPDLLAAAGADAVLAAAPGDGAGGFHPAIAFAAAPGAAGSLAVGDLNGDGRQDAVLAQGLARDAGALLNAGTPVVTGLSRTPVSGLVPSGTVVTFNLRFSAPVAATGTPVLRLASGDAAALAGGSGSRILAFSVVLGADTPAEALVPAATGAVELAGGSITDLPGTLAADLGGADGRAPASAAVPVPAAPTIEAIARDTGADDRITAAPQVELRGRAEAGATILATVDGVHVATGQADATGAFRVFLPVVAEGSRSLGAIAVGRQGGVSDPAAAIAVVFDRTAPAAPTLAVSPDTGASATDGITATGLLTVSGTAEPGSSVALFNGTAPLGTVVADGLGHFSHAVQLAEGTHALRATATDIAGNVSAAGTLTVRVDSGAPDAPGLLAISPDTGTADDRLTNTGTLAVLASAEPGSLVSVFEGTTLLGTGTAGTDGEVWVPLAALTEGAHGLTATATDAAGNVSALSTTMQLRVDLTTPAAPAIQGITPDNGPSDSDGITNDGAISIVGTAEPGALVEVRSTTALNINGDTFLGAGLADSNGVFRVPVTLAASRPTYDLTATATDAAGNASVLSAAYRIAFSTRQPPQPSIATIDPDTGTDGDNLTGTGSITLRGTARPDTTVLVRDGTQVIAQGYADPAYGGAFAIPLVLGEGKHALSVVAQDIGGTLSTPSGTLVVEVDETPPSRPILGGITPDTGRSAADAVTGSIGIAYTGSAEPFARVAIYNQSGLLGEGTADASGAFTVHPLLDLAPGTYTTTAVAVDRAGNASLPSAPLSVVVDTTAPAAPGLLSIAPNAGGSAADGTAGSGALTLRGTAEAGSLVHVFSGGATAIGSATAAADGSFAMAIDLPEGPAALTATATDVAGNVSAASAALQVSVDLSAPAAPVLAGIAPDTGRRDTDNITATGTVTLRGTAEAGSTVRVTIAGTGTVVSGVAAEDGTFAIPLVLAEGENRLTATATDTAGNVSAVSGTLPVTVDLAAPAAPGGIAFIGDRGAPARSGASVRPIVRVAGTAEPGALATVSVAGLDIGRALADSKGHFSVVLDRPLVLAGSETVSVTATDAAGNASAARDASVTLRTALGFAPAAPVGVALSGFDAVPEQVLQTAALDWNRDGRVDLAAATSRPSFDQPFALNLLLGDGTGGFVPTLSIPLNGQPLHLAAAEAGPQRLLVADFGALRLITGNGAGGVASIQDVFISDAGGGVALADLDGDRVPDILAWGGSLTWASASSHFAATATIDMGTDLRDVAARDIDGDGITDLAALDRGTQAVTIRLGLGGGSFGGRADIPLGGMPLSLVLADATGDGRPDLLVGMEDDGIALRAGLAGGGFAAPSAIASASGLVSLRAADLNGDGTADLLAGLDTGAVQLWLGDGAGSFAKGPALGLGADAAAAPPLVADINADGRPDLVSGSQAGYDPRPDLFSGAVGVVRNVGRVSVRSVAAVPPSGAVVPGDTVDIDVRFTAPVALAGGTPRLLLANAGTASFRGLSGDTMRFRYVLGDGGVPTALALADAAALDLGGGTLTDLSGGAADIAAMDGAVLWQDYVPCYVPGTRIETAHGPVPIEELSIGDEVRTVSGALRPIRWIGRRSYGGRFIAGNRRALPVTIRADAWAPGIPARDLTISPLHALYLEGVLIEAKDLLNGTSITQASAVESVTYYNLDLGTHDVILAEGMPAESFVGDESRALFQNAAEYRALYPDAPPQPMVFCAPRLDHGLAFHGACNRLAQRAGLPVERVASATARMPRGFVDRVCGQVVEGWAQCPDQPEDRVLVEILMDGVVLGQALANRYRADLEAAGLGSGRHAFTFTAPDGVVLCAETVAVRRVPDGAMLCRGAGLPSDGGSPGTASARGLRGAVDLIAPASVHGWIQCPDAPEDRVMVEVVMDGKVVGSTLADRYRADLHKAGLGSGRHGFAFQAPDGVVLHPDRVVVRRAADGAAIRNVPERVRGSLDSVAAARIEGWMLSLDDPDEPVLVQVMMDGVAVGQALADRYRPDLHAAGLGNGRHGFVFEPPEGMLLHPDRIAIRPADHGAWQRPGIAARVVSAA